MKNKQISKVLKVLSVTALSSMFALSTFSSGAHAATGDATVTPSTPQAQFVTAAKVPTSTPIKHVVVIFQENISFDHYFGTYPYALNPAGVPQFHAKPGTPLVNNLLTPKDYNGTQPDISKENLLSENPNSSNPARLERSQAITSGMDHSQGPEIASTDGGKMDKFLSTTGRENKLVMNYYDGNTVTGLWNYAQNFAMDDNSFGTQYGPSTPGALNLISGDTTGASAFTGNSTTTSSPTTSSALNSDGTVVGDSDPFYDNASNPKYPTLKMSDNKINVGNLLNDKGVTWGWFQGGFADTTASSKNAAGNTVSDYSAHHEPFQYYKSTSNPTHAAPSSVDNIGENGPANHQYDLTNFWQAVNNGNMPSVSFLKAKMSQDGHSGYSGPLDEQKFLVDTINKLEKSPDWNSTAVVIAYDDSDGWYDHVFSPSNGVKTATGQTGYGMRQPFLVISPYAKQNYVDHTLTDQTSILKFIEDNWSLGRIGGNSLDNQAGSILNMFDFSKNAKLAPKVFLNDQTGEVTSTAPTFPDLGTYAKQIDYLTNNEVIHGFKDGTFKPTSDVSRVQVVNMILKQKGIDPSKVSAPNPGFKDVQPGDPNYQAIAVAAKLGFIKGEKDGKFDPYGHVTRGQLAAILTRAYNLTGKSDSQFKDVKNGNSFYDAINALSANKIIKGFDDGTFRPYEAVSRGQFAVFLYNYLNK